MAELIHDPFPGSHTSVLVPEEAATYFVVQFNLIGWGGFDLLIGLDKQPEVYAASYDDATQDLANDLFTLRQRRPIFSRFGLEVKPLPVDSKNMFISALESRRVEFVDRSRGD